MIPKNSIEYVAPISRIQFEPGNGTRYDLMYSKSPHGYLLVWLNRGGSGGAAFRFSGDTFIAAGYLREKMNLPEHLMGDVHALLAFLRTKGHQAEVVGFYSEAGEYIPPTRQDHTSKETV